MRNFVCVVLRAVYRNGTCRVNGKLRQNWETVVLPQRAEVRVRALSDEIRAGNQRREFSLRISSFSSLHSL